MDCLFCKIVAGEIPNYTVYQDENVLAFLDIHPCSKGHTVLVSKKHFDSISGMSEIEWAGVMAGLQKTVEKVYQVLSPDGMNIGVNDRPAAGQAVPHVHWHLIPRRKGDGGGSMHSIVRTKEDAEVKEVAELFA